ncbi:MAG: hypothetical protein LUF85_15425 [Bacteroides sp.]|nr:hypothetical protein [Bacteroides sp.]
MAAIAGFLLAGMLSRIAGPIAQDWFEYNTEWGRGVARRKREKEVEKARDDLNNKRILSQEEHERRLKDLRLQFEYKKQESERQILLAQADWNQKHFIQHCWPLRNPFEVPLGLEPVYEEHSERIKSCRLKTILLPNKEEIVPLRIISALKESEHPHASTVNSEMFMFLVNHYSSNGRHAVLSDIGAWKSDVPVNDASINYLFKGLQGQPVMVIAPEYTIGGTFVRIKIWSWGLGEKLNYPVGFDFGWLDLETLYQRTLAHEIRSMGQTLKKVNARSVSPEMKQDLEILSLMEQNRNQLSKTDAENLLSLLSTPEEVNFAVKKKTFQVVAQMYECIVAMYADGYHLLEYGTMPLLPELLPEKKDIRFMLPALRDYYLTLINTALIQGLVTPVQAAEFGISLARSLQALDQKRETIAPVSGNVRELLFDMSGSVDKHIIDELRNQNKALYGYE